MPSIKFRQALQIGKGTRLKDVIAGSFVVNAPAFNGNTAGSTESACAAFTGLTASHLLILGNASVTTTQPTCVIPLLGRAGTDGASILFLYVAGSGGAAGSDVTMTIPFIAIRH